MTTTDTSYEVRPLTAETWSALSQTRKLSSSFLYSSTRQLHERLGFTYDRPKGLKNCVMRIEVPAR